jgi:hypothetical protein
MTTPGLPGGISYEFLWFVDQTTGDVSLCFENAMVIYSDKGRKPPVAGLTSIPAAEAGARKVC